MRWYLVCATAIGGLIAVSSGVHAYAQQMVFYAIGHEDQSKVNSLYEVDSTTLKPIKSAPLDVTAGALSGDGKTIVLVEKATAKKAGLLLVSAADLKTQSSMTIPESAMPTDYEGNPVTCPENIFVHPISGITYLACNISNGGWPVPKLIEINPFKRTILSVKFAIADQLTSRVFLYDPARRWLYIDGNVIVNSRNEIIGTVEEHHSEFVPARHQVENFVGIRLPGRAGLSVVRDMSLLPDGDPILLFQFLDPPYLSYTAVLAIIDPVHHKVLRTWTENKSYACTVYGRIHGVMYNDTPMNCWYAIHNAPVSSRDGSRLFGIGQNEGYVIEVPTHPVTPVGVLWDSSDLQVIRRFKLPESPSDDCNRVIAESRLEVPKPCFITAPDGRGMWYFGRSGKIYRLDGHTGALLGEVKLPFHLISLIREP